MSQAYKFIITEIQKSICSHEKQIVKHKDKITNPSKHCPAWNNLHPEKKALVEKRWPNEIQCYTEQKEGLSYYIQEVSGLLKEYAKQAKTDAEHSEKGSGRGV